MNGRLRESEFLKELLAYDDCARARELQELLAAADRNEHCLFSSCRLVALIGILSGLGFGYTAVLLPEFFNNSSHILIRLFSALGLGSAFCLVVFAALWAWYRASGGRVREECRNLIGRMLSTRLRPGAERTAPVVQHGPYLSVMPASGVPLRAKPDEGSGSDLRRAG